MRLLRLLSICFGLPTFAALAGVGVLVGCTTVPEVLRSGPEGGPDPAQVRAKPEQYTGMTVRWGGVIVTVENGPELSTALVVARPLSSSSRPQETDQSLGRFVARISGFVDPVDYAAGREITVVGVVEGVEKRTVGTYPYSYPVVQVMSHYLWPLRQPPVQDPFYYSPFYGPWYPYPYGPYTYPYPYP